eukprot:GEMP01039919.1.p1 GENE.GEMP01039919.1~~GEMP01039919.1.p1  ORF type:complete len:101 (-),score=0.22 GEMP01039919.1:556-858(-)
MCKRVRGMTTPPPNYGFWRKYTKPRLFPPTNYRFQQKYQPPLPGYYAPRQLSVSEYGWLRAYFRTLRQRKLISRAAGIYATLVDHMERFWLRENSPIHFT